MTKHLRLTSLKTNKEAPLPQKKKKKNQNQYIEFYGINRPYYQVIFLLTDIYDVLNFFLL